MKSSFKTFKVFITGVCVCVFSLSSFFSPANNIRINGTVKVAQGTGDTLVLSFPLRWDNSWRDQFNWDAAWVFLKYKSGTGSWNHVNLCAGGHRFMDGSGLPVPFNYMPGNTGSSTVGFFVYRNTLEAGNTPEITCQIKCLKSSLGNLTPDQFTNHEGFVLVQAVEMVYVSYGAYYLGDGSCSNRFAGSDKNPVLIDNEDAITASTVIKVYPVTNNITGSAQSITAVYPKGYKGFYMMKYEVSQEQWVYFLNTLTYVQQQERVPGLTTLKGGDYIFGSKSEPSNRNGIIIAEPSYNGGSAIFANNLHNDNSYSQDDDGKTIACNYLSPSDMAAYCSWAGLRPMSELEYEKACRQGYPEPAIPNEYAWHDNSIGGHLGTVSNSGMRNERSNTANANVNAGNNFGPVRCGLFATGSSTQQSAGTAFWGGAELSGNLKEMCYNLTYTGFNGSTMGTGAYNTALWSATPAHVGVRGGGFSSADSLLRVSDRTEAGNYFTATEQRDSTVGFRGVRTIGSDVTVTQGNLIATVNGGNITTVCPGMLVDITTDSPAKVISGSHEVPNMDFTYVWYDGNGNVIPGETGDVLHFSNFEASGNLASVSYQFKRKAVCPLGEVSTTVLTLTMPNLSITLTPDETGIDACDNSTKITASAYCNNPVFTWKYGTGSKTGNTYIPGRGDFNGAGNFRVEVTVSSGSCTSEKRELKVNIPYIQEIASNLVTLENCGNVLAIDGRDNKRYCTVKIGSQCWMGKNLDAGTFQTINGDYWKFDEPGIQKFCLSNLPDNCNKYGGLYEWWETVCGGECNSNLTPPNATMGLSNENSLIAYGAKMVPGSTTQVQGICPDGWHLPRNDEWIARCDYNQWYTDGYLYCGSSFQMGGGLWWSSTPESGGSSNNRQLLADGSLTYNAWGFRYHGFSVRCIKD